MRILALTRYERLGSSSRVRFYQYVPYLESKGIDIQIASLLPDEYVRGLYEDKRVNIVSIINAYIKRVAWLLRNKTFDLLWVEKEILPWIPAWIEFLFSSKLPYIVDYDDAVFHRYEFHHSKLIRSLLGKKIDNVMRNSLLVIAGNDYLAMRAHQAGAKWIEILPSVVNVEQYPVKKAQSGLNIGWIGSPATASFLSSIQVPLERVVGSSNVQLTLVGAGKKDPLPGVIKIFLPWHEATEIADLQTFDVGIMPLPDGPFERGKCGYKLIQYMASGLPVIASPIGVNKKIVEQGKNGYLATTEAEWLEALNYLKTHVEDREKMGLAGRKRAEKNYNLQVTAPRLLKIIQNI